MKVSVTKNALIFNKVIAEAVSDWLSVAKQLGDTFYQRSRLLYTYLAS